MAPEEPDGEGRAEAKDRLRKLLSPGCDLTELGPLERMLEGVCTRFVFARCKRGARCRFSHDVDRAAIQAEAGVPEAPPPQVSRSVASSTEAAGRIVATEKAADSAEGQRRPAWRSVDWLLKGDSVHRHPYLQEFAAAPWLPALLEMPEFASMWNMRGKSLRKEISESFGALHACQRALAQLGVESGHGVTVFDLCCGKGLESLVLAKSLPQAQVVAVDTNPNMELGHFRHQANLSFLALDVTSASAGSRLAAAAAEKALTTAQPAAAPLLIVGVHLCGSLSDHAMRLFKEAPGPAALVLLPCCFDGRDPSIKRRAKMLRVDPHRYRCLSMLMSLPTSEQEKRELLVDDDIMSEKNSILIATRALSQCTIRESRCGACLVCDDTGLLLKEACPLCLSDQEVTRNYVQTPHHSEIAQR